VSAQIAHGARFEVVTPAGTATDLGTRFRIRFAAGAMALSVSEGRVLLANAHGRRVVAAGGEAVARTDSAPALVGSTLPARQAEGGEPVFHPRAEQSMSLQKTPDTKRVSGAVSPIRADGEGGFVMKRKTLRAAALAAAASALLVGGAPRTHAQDAKKPDKAALRAQGAAAGAADAQAGAKGDGAVEVIDATKLPPDVVEAVQKAAPNAEIRTITRRSKGNSDIYTLQLLVEGKPRLISLLHVLSGSMLEAVSAKDLPAAVLAAFQKAMPNGLPADFEKSTAIGPPDDGATTYAPRPAGGGEGKVARGTASVSVTVSADGQTLTVVETLAPAA
jgi:hypothetical protein